MKIGQREMEICNRKGGTQYGEGYVIRRRFTFSQTLETTADGYARDINSHFSK